MMASEYGMLPTDVAEVRPHERSRLERFRLNQAIFRATEQFERDNRERGESGGVATEAERKQLIQKQEDRASASSHGSIAEQQEAL